MEVSNSRVLAAICIATFAGHALLGYESHRQRLEQEVRLLNTSHDLLCDQVGELSYANQQLQMRLGSERSEGFTSGALSVLKSPESFNGIWHDGYDHGQSAGLQMMAGAE